MKILIQRLAEYLYTIVTRFKLHSYTLYDSMLLGDIQAMSKEMIKQKRS